MAAVSLTHFSSVSLDTFIDPIVVVTSVLITGSPCL
jgi:hypothetical protein